VTGLPLSADQTLAVEYEDTSFRDDTIRILGNEFRRLSFERTLSASWTLDTTDVPLTPMRGTFVKAEPYVWMADRGSFNLIAAARDSWRLTWEEQFGILRYLALIGFVLAVLLIGAAVAAGAGMASLVGQDSAPTLQIGAIVGRFIVGIPIAFLTVLVPAGIYRQLTQADLSAEVFA